MDAIGKLIYLLLGKWGVTLVIGIGVLVYTFRNSEKVFRFIEDNTFGNRDYLLEKFDLLFIEVKPDHVTYGLLFASFGMGTLVFGLFALLGSYFWGVFFAIVFIILGWKLPRPIVDYMVAKRVEKYSDQMVDSLNLLSNGLRAGLSLPQAVGMVVDEMPAPISQEFNIILQQNRLGVPIDECFQNLMKRVPTEDNEMFVTSIVILRESGGNLAEVFDTITDVIRERVRLAQKLATATASAKAQGTILFLMPFMMSIIFTLQDSAMMYNFVTSVGGIIALIIALTLNLIGGWMMWKISQIRV